MCYNHELPYLTAVSYVTWLYIARTTTFYCSPSLHVMVICTINAFCHSLSVYTRQSYAPSLTA